jgi:hypothetical protein
MGRKQLFVGQGCGSFGVDVKVQQQRLRRADFRTSMNVYTQASANKTARPIPVL